MTFWTPVQIPYVAEEAAMDINRKITDLPEYIALPEDVPVGDGPTGLMLLAGLYEPKFKVWDRRENGEPSEVEYGFVEAYLMDEQEQLLDRGAGCYEAFCKGAGAYDVASPVGALDADFLRWAAN